MPRTISIGAQDFERLRTNGYFYVDKTAFIREWWEDGDAVTLICRPRRFGKTLALSTVECFLSTRFAERGEELFGGLDVWADPVMRELQGTVPTIFLSFAGVKQRDLPLAKASMKRVLRQAVRAHDYLQESKVIDDDDRAFLASVSDGMDDDVATGCLGQLCSMLERHWGVAPVVLLDEYDTPMQEAWMGGYWDEMVAFQRSLFNNTFKTNPALGRGLMTGVTRVSRESIFSDLNNLEVITTSGEKYPRSFGFTEEEVFSAMEEFGRSDDEAIVREWYDGFTFGGVPDIYNPWSITKYLESGRFDTYWANTSGNGLVSTLVREGDAELKRDFETLLAGGTIAKAFDEQVVFGELGRKQNAIWALLLSAGYVRTVGQLPKYVRDPRELAITNYETTIMFEDMVNDWFGEAFSSYGHFTRALLRGDLDEMNDYLGDVVLACVSSFDTGASPSARTQPERFYHGLVLGLLVELRGRYAVESNRESGYGRYDVALVPLGPDDPAIVIEFKVFDARREATLEDTVGRALGQIEARAYAASLVERGIEASRIRTYGIAFRGKEVLVG